MKVFPWKIAPQITFLRKLGLIGNQVTTIEFSQYDVYIIAYLEAFRFIYQNIYNILFHNSKLSAAYYGRDQCIYVYQ